RTGGVSFEHPREDAYLVAFTALADAARGAAAAAGDILPQIRLAVRHAPRAAVNDAAHRRPVALTKGGHREQLADGVARHDGAVRISPCACGAPAVARASAETPP